MKKLISFLLAIVMTVSLVVPAIAEESEEAQYGIIRFEFSDTPGSIKNLDVMVLNGFVYTNVESFCSRMGYDVEWGEASDGEIRVHVTAFSDLWMDNMPTLELQFVVDATTVYYNPLCGIEIAYTAPAPCVQNERGTWIPLSYTLNLLGGSRNIAGDVLVIHKPFPSILSVATVIAKNKSLLSFDWTDDFGYSEIATGVTDGAARVVTLFSGLIEFDGRSWSSFIDWNAFDKKFGKSLAAMMCTHSEDELQEYIENVEGMLDVFDPEGAIGSMLHSQQAMIDSDVNAWEKICEEKLAQLQSGSGTLPQYNMAYQQYERATKKQALFAAIGADDVISIQDGLAEATNALKYATWIGYGVTYLDEFQQRDDFQATVLMDYFATRRKTGELDDAAARAIADYASSDIIEYTAGKFFEEHALEIVVDESGLDALMGVPANLLLLAWDIMSENIPFYSDGLKSVEAREISNYAQQVQNDASLNVGDLLQSMRTDSASITPEDCVRLAEYCYVYLKACYIARSFAIDSLEGISEEAQQKLQSKIEVETNINQYIAKYLAILGQADLENSCYILGFLPENNDELLGIYSDDALLTSVVDVETQFGRTTQKLLNQIKVYKKIGDLDVLTNIKTFHYGEDGYLQSIDEEQFDTSGTVTNRGTVLIEMDSKGRMTKREPDINLEWDYEYVEYIYNDNDQLIRSDWYSGGPTEYYYDGEGRLIREEESMGDMGNCIAEYTYVDNVLAKKTITTQYFGFGNSEGNVEEIMYTLDIKGKIVEENNITRSQATKYIYDYWPIVASTTTYERGSLSSGFQYNDCVGHSIFTDWLDDMEFFTDSEGQLIRITGIKNLISYTYEFVYDQTPETVPENNQAGSYLYSTSQIATMVKSYFVDDWDNGTLLVILRSESDGIAYYSLKFDPDDPEEYPEGMSMPISEIMVDMMTGEMFVDYEFRAFLW